MNIKVETKKQRAREISAALSKKLGVIYSYAGFDENDKKCLLFQIFLDEFTNIPGIKELKLKYFDTKRVIEEIQEVSISKYDELMNTDTVFQATQTEDSQSISSNDMLYAIEKLQDIASEILNKFFRDIETDVNQIFDLIETANNKRHKMSLKVGDKLYLNKEFFIFPLLSKDHTLSQFIKDYHWNNNELVGCSSEIEMKEFIRCTLLIITVFCHKFRHRGRCALGNDESFGELFFAKYWFPPCYFIYRFIISNNINESYNPNTFVQSRASWIDLDGRPIKENLYYKGLPCKFRVSHFYIRCIFNNYPSHNMWYIKNETKNVENHFNALDPRVCADNKLQCKELQYYADSDSDLSEQNSQSIEKIYIGPRPNQFIGDAVHIEWRANPLQVIGEISKHKLLLFVLLISVIVVLLLLILRHMRKNKSKDNK